MFLFGISDHVGGFDPLILLLMALVIETYAGQLSLLSRLTGHPITTLTGITDWFDRKLNRESRSQMDRAVRGALASLVLICLAATFGWGVAWLSQTLPFAWIIETVLLLMLINQRGVYKAVRKVGVALRDHGLEVARNEMSALTTNAPEKMDLHSIARAAIEVLATSLTTRIVAPVFWYVLFGFPGLAVYQTVAVMNNRLGHKTERHRAFGFTAARLNDILMIVPAQLAGLFTVTASLFVPTANPVQSFRTMLKEARNFPSYNLGVTIAAFAGAFKLALAGPQKFTQETKNEPWIGSGTAQATHQDIRRSLYLFAVACLLNGVWIAALTIVRYM
jgi:adenosylcobinamide-phosphate synthase